ncbi:hypothetical protein [Fulvivirga ligni]|uniref:hypothetical protein n=1 Tax=Fulvivirga ligni TaxID=2904246 RepID=UPI001F4463B7|nr:hypothetical protein [Fulvivirga ligni]UII19296.1 hypothetical protein LVD16_15740 [Fulvivirga ligni]
MKKIYLLFICIIGLATSCDIGDNETDPTTSFLKIYDDNTYESSYIPIDIKQTSDGGYLVLSATRKAELEPLTGVRVIKLDANGDFEKQQDLDGFSHPVGDLMEIDGNFYFIAMTTRAEAARVVIFMIDNTGTLADPITLSSVRNYPFCATKTDDGKILLLSFDNKNLNTVFTESDINGSILKSSKFSLGPNAQDIGEPFRTINESFFRTGKKQPYLIGKMNDQTYYFNGFYNFTLSFIFTNLDGDNSVIGQINGQHRVAGISAALNLDGNNFAISRFNYGDNYLYANYDAEPLLATSSVNIGGNIFPELVQDATVIIKEVSIGSRDITIFASNTKTGQIILLAFEGKTLVGTKYLGFGNSYEIANFSTTEDNGLIILGNTYITGRFNRLCTFKLSEEELRDIIE